MEQKVNGWSNWETWNFNMYYGDAIHEDIQEGQAESISGVKAIIESYKEELLNESMESNLLVSVYARQSINKINVQELADSRDDILAEALEQQ